MRELIELIEEYPNYFKGCYDERDVVKVLDDLHRSREIYYLDAKGIGTYDSNEAEIVERTESYDKAFGYYSVELATGRNVEAVIKVHIECYLSDFDEEEGYTMESYQEIGWE